MPKIDKEAERAKIMIENAETVEELEELSGNIKEEQMDIFNEKKDKLSKKTK